jgi:hypothetical protein
MTADETAAIRSRLSEYMALRPVRNVAAPRQQTAHAKIPNLSPKLMPFMAAFLSLLLAGGSVSYAAEGSLPGDTLYPVKVRVNEEVRAALTLDAEAKAEWEASRAERRLAEATALMEAKVATPEALDRIEENFAKHEERVEATIAIIEEKKGPEAAARISSHLEASLAAHKTILEKFSGEDDADVSAESDVAVVTNGLPQSSARILAKVEKAKEKAKSVRERTEKEVTDEHAAKRAGELADVKLRVTLEIATKLEARLDGNEEGIGARVLLSLDESIVAAERLIATGDAALAEGRYNDAFRAYNEAVRELRGAEIFAQGDFAVAKETKVAVAKETKVAEGDVEVEAKAEVKVETKIAPPAFIEKIVKPIVPIRWGDEHDDDAGDEARLRADAEGKRGYAVTEIDRLRARIAAFAADGHDWTDGKASLAKAEAYLADGDAQFSAARYAEAYASFKEAYHIATGANGQYVYVPKEPVDEEDDGDAEARARAEMKRGYAMSALDAYEASIAVKIGYVGEDHEYVAEMRARLAAGEAKVAEGDALLAAGSYDAAYEAYLGVWGELSR